MKFATQCWEWLSEYSRTNLELIREKFCFEGIWNIYPGIWLLTMYIHMRIGYWLCIFITQVRATILWSRTAFNLVYQHTVESSVKFWHNCCSHTHGDRSRQSGVWFGDWTSCVCRYTDILLCECDGGRRQLAVNTVYDYISIYYIILPKSYVIVWLIRLNVTWLD